jgi:hypothetical protein
MEYQIKQEMWQRFRGRYPISKITEASVLLRPIFVHESDKVTSTTLPVPCGSLRQSPQHGGASPLRFQPRS